MRKILHVDINSYFATMEQQAYPNLRGKPVGVAGKGKGERTVVAGASIEAKKFGVRSGMSTWEAERLCPAIIIIPADYDRYIFTSKRIFNMLERFSPSVDIFSIDEAFVDLGDKLSWDDCVSIAHQIKQLIRTQIGSWVSCSIGISYGKTLAKLAAELNKPDGLVVIRPEDFPTVAATTPIGELCGIGFRLEPRLRRMGIKTIAEMGEWPKEQLIKIFGDYTGSWMHNIGNGIDDNIIRSFRSLPQEKSLGHSYTLPRDVTDFEEVKRVLLLLSERLGVRARHKALLGRVVSVYLRFHDGTGWGERVTLKEYLQDSYEIYQAGSKLFDRLGPHRKAVRLVGITLNELVQLEQVSQPIFPERQRYEQLISSIDKINHRYGELTVFRANLAMIKFKVFNLPDGRNKRLYLPEIHGINPFTKRV